MEVSLYNNCYSSIGHRLMTYSSRYFEHTQLCTYKDLEATISADKHASGHMRVVLIAIVSYYEIIASIAYNFIRTVPS